MCHILDVDPKRSEEPVLNHLARQKQNLITSVPFLMYNIFRNKFILLIFLYQKQISVTLISITIINIVFTRKFILIRSWNCRRVIQYSPILDQRKNYINPLFFSKSIFFNGDWIIKANSNARSGISVYGFTSTLNYLLLHTTESRLAWEWQQIMLK